MYSSIDCVTFIKSFTPEKRTRNVFQHCLRAFLLRAYHLFLWSACISTVFQHFLRAFPLLREAMESLNSTSHPLNLSTSQPLNLSGGVSTSQPAFRLYSSTACVHFYCISIVLQHFSLCASLRYSSTECVHSY